jgi:uncharacterized protein YxeA
MLCLDFVDICQLQSQNKKTVYIKRTGKTHTVYTAKCSTFNIQISQQQTTNNNGEAESTIFAAQDKASSRNYLKTYFETRH